MMSQFSTTFKLPGNSREQNRTAPVLYAAQSAFVNMNIHSSVFNLLSIYGSVLRNIKLTKLLGVGFPLWPTSNLRAVNFKQHNTLSLHNLPVWRLDNEVVWLACACIWGIG